MTVTLQELAERYGGTADSGMLAYFDLLLQWRQHVPKEIAADLLQRMEAVLHKTGTVHSLEETRQGLVDEITRLNVERSKLRKENETNEQNLQSRRDWLAQYERTKKELERLTAEAVQMEEQKPALEREIAEMQKKYAESKKIADEVQQNVWLSSQVKEGINKIWCALPMDELDKALTKKG